MAGMTIKSSFLNKKRTNTARLKKQIHAQASRFWRDAINVFLDAMADRIAVDTGMSMASLGPLAKEVRRKTAFLQAIRGMGPKFRSKNYSGYKNDTGLVKSKAAGTRLGEAAYTLSFGSPTTPVFKLSFEIAVFQFYLWEFGLAKGNEGKSWGALDAGRTAFLDFVQTKYATYFSADIISRWIFEG